MKHGLRTIAAIREAIRERRLRRLPVGRILNAKQTSHALCVAPGVVRALIDAGELRAQKQYGENGKFAFAIHVRDVRALAETDLLRCPEKPDPHAGNTALSLQKGPR